MLKYNEQYLGFISTSFRIILFSLCTTFVVHRGYECFKKYMDKPEAIDLSYKFTGSDEIPFPSFTFCPYNTSFNRYIEVTNYICICFNRLSRRKRGMASKPLFIISDFFLHFSNELCYGYLRFEGNGKIPSNLR